MAWWWLITFVISKVRNRFNVKAMWLMNRIIGCILMTMAAVGLYKGIRGYIDLDNDQTVTTITADAPKQTETGNLAP